MRSSLLIFATLVCAAACREDPVSTVVNTGTIDGVPFTVFDGVAHQAVEDGAVLGESNGAIIVLNQNPAALGMSDGARLHLRTTFALRHGGRIAIAAFGPASDPFGPGTGVVIGRNDSEFGYAVHVVTDPVLDSLFVPAPADPNAEHTVAIEFYAQDVPGYGTGNAITMWPLDDLTPALGEDVIGCSRGPAMSSVSTLPGDRIAFALSEAFLLSVEVVDTIVGPTPCP
jgi:hypothetical protein